MMSKKAHILIVFGTRPEAIKMAPLVKAFQRHPRKFRVAVCVTGQHRQMVDPLLTLFGITPDYDLKIMQKNQRLEYITASVLMKIGKIIDKEKADYLFVQGDTTTAMAASLAAFYRNITIAHVEAGLRTWDTQHPYPEEANRRIIDSVSDLYFAHTEAARRNLLREGVSPRKIEVTGNTVIDALLDAALRNFDFAGSPFGDLARDKRKVILVTAHRRESFGKPIQNICEALKTVALRHKREAVFVYPVHLNPNIQKPVHAILSGIENIRLTKPLDYLCLVHLIKRSYFVLTDSGGLQEEAPSLGKPVLVLRQTTERPEGVRAGCVEVIGTRKAGIVEKVSGLLEDTTKYRRMAKAVNPYGDGRASERIVKRMLRETGAL